MNREVHVDITSSSRLVRKGDHVVISGMVVYGPSEGCSAQVAVTNDQLRELASLVAQPIEQEDKTP